MDVAVHDAPRRLGGDPLAERAVRLEEAAGVTHRFRDPGADGAVEVHVDVGHAAGEGVEAAAVREPRQVGELGVEPRA